MLSNKVFFWSQLTILMLMSTVFIFPSFADTNTPAEVSDSLPVVNHPDDANYGLEKTLEYNFSPVDRARLRKALADENTFSNLIVAGYRKQSHIYVFLFFRIVLPPIMLIVAGTYVFGISDMERHS